MYLYGLNMLMTNVQTWSIGLGCINEVSLLRLMNWHYILNNNSLSTNNIMFDDSRRISHTPNCMVLYLFNGKIEHGCFDIAVIVCITITPALFDVITTIRCVFFWMNN